MNYELTKTVQGRIEYNVDQAMSYGDFPPSMIMAKFEETNMGPDEDVYDDYARGVLVDRRPDTNKFEHEEARTTATQNSGRLNLQYYGHRGTAETPYRPESFDGFIGPDDRDPRGINVEPDMKEMRKQHDARMRFVRWDSDQSDHITGGGRSEGKVMADQQKLFKVVRNRLKVFDRQIDGRKEGIRKEFRHKSNIPKQVLVQSYGDYIKDYALNPQRSANIICKQILRDTRAFRESTTDSDFAFVKYSQLCRRAQTKMMHNPTASAHGGQDGDFAEGDNSRCYKAAGLLMSNIVRGKKQGMDIVKQSDMDMSEAKETVARKTEPFAKDLALILRAMTQDSEFATGDVTMTVKTATPTVLEHLARQVTYNHLAPAHHYLNAEILYKTVKPGADTRKIKDQIITDANAPELRDVKTQNGKTAKMKLASGAKLNVADDADKTESDNTFNYRHVLRTNGDKRIRLTSGDGKKGESDNTQERRINHQNHRTADVRDVENNMRFSDNSCKERHTRGLGSKYLNRFIDRDARDGEIAATNA